MSVRIDRIRPHWDWVRPALASLIESTNEEIIPEDVFASCERGESIFIVSDEGFVVACEQQCQYTGNKTLLIWFAYAKELGHDCVGAYMPFFLELAKELGCKYILTKTSFEPVCDHLERHGWKRGLVEYTVEVR